MFHRLQAGFPCTAAQMPSNTTAVISRYFISMIAAFKKRILSLGFSEPQLENFLNNLTDQDWEKLIGIFVARLPECEAVIGSAGNAFAANKFASARGIRALHLESIEKGSGEVIILTNYLAKPESILQLAENLRAAGWTVPVVATAVEITSLGARSLLSISGITVRAAIQVANTPNGIILERREPSRWTKLVDSETQGN